MKNSRFEKEVQGGTVQPAGKAQLSRVARLVAIALIVEACLAGVAHLQPAMAGLFRSVYWAVGLVFGVAVGRAMRHRTGHDRRAGERRH